MGCKSNKKKLKSEKSIAFGVRSAKDRQEYRVMMEKVERFQKQLQGKKNLLLRTHWGQLLIAN